MHTAAGVCRSMTETMQGRKHFPAEVEDRRPPSVLSPDAVKAIQSELASWKLNPDIQSSNMLSVFDQTPLGVRSADWIGFVEVNDVPYRHYYSSCR